ncbi:MAG: ectonucleotide pyrophosphatase/phosphodiesterase, partial [Polyangiales bacterium]
MRQMATRGQTLVLSLLCTVTASACTPPRPTHVLDARGRRTPSGPIKHVVVVTVDGLVPDSYLHPDAHGLKVPTLRRLVADGAYSEGALSTFPSVTYPAHTSIATGVNPGRHGIVSNRSFDPLELNREAWFWYAEDLKVKPLWQVAHDVGYRTALINWPVTVGARANWLWTEIWRAKHPEDLKLIHALSTPGLARRVEHSFPGHAQRAVPPDNTDESGVDIAARVFQEGAPTLLFLHIHQVDGSQHKHGLWSEEAKAAIEGADQQLGRLFKIVERAQLAATTAFVIASDHGFADVTRQVNPGALLREAGLVELDPNGKVLTWHASAVPSGGTTYLYVNESSPDAADRVSQLFERKASEAGSGIARVLKPADIAALGGDPKATLALEAELGVIFGSGYQTYEGTPLNRAAHGYSPQRPEMRASLLVIGPTIKRGVVPDARLVDIAPTIASWLALPLPE